VTPLTYTMVVGAVALERLFELWLARRNTVHQMAAGGTEYGSRHYPAMVMLHTGFLAGCVAEVWLAGHIFIPTLGYTMFAILITAQAIRYWVVTTLGRQWTTRVIVVPGAQRIRTGPYRFLSHPNYVAVVGEGIALPLIYGNWITAAVFFVANGILLTIRIRCENRALRELAG